MVAHLDYFRRHAPGFENAWLMLSAPQVGIWHTRRLVGRHKLTIGDCRAGTVSADEVGVSPSPSQKFANVSVGDVDLAALQAELARQGVFLQGVLTGAMAGGPPRGPNVSMTADTPAL
jgi:hypothetical protein